MGAGEDGHHHLRHVEPALVPGSDTPSRRAGTRDEPGGRGRAARGVFIIHAPSSCMDAYKDHPARKRPRPHPRPRTCRRKSASGATRSRPRRKGLPDRPVRRRLRRRAEVPAGIALEVADRRHRDPGRGRHQRLGRRDLEPAGKPGDPNVMLMGVHTNMCVLGRPFGLRHWPARQECRPRARPDRHHVQLAELALCQPLRGNQPDHRAHREIRRPTITSTDLTGQPAFHFQPDDRPRAVFVIGEDEYKTEITLPAFATRSSSRWASAARS